MGIYYWFFGSLKKSWFLWALILINFLGSIYGFYWYKNQLADTFPRWLTWFVPDSPTGSSLFTLYLIFLLAGRSIPSLTALAAVTNFKYGVWAVSIILGGWSLGNPPSWPDVMLMVSHGGMAVESLLYSGFYSLKLRHMVPAACWVIANDYFDYFWDVHPWLPDVLNPYVINVGIFTFLLSMASLILIYQLGSKGKTTV
jgi:uncharacterized membrane protein YpjA